MSTEASGSTEVTKNEERSRYEIAVDGELRGIADYVERGDVVVFPHTEIDPAMRGRGLGAVLVKAALDDVRPSGRSVAPHCWYVAEYIDLHPEYADMRRP